jgi:hypothetical protein
MGVIFHTLVRLLHNKVTPPTGSKAYFICPEDEQTGLTVLFIHQLMH